MLQQCYSPTEQMLETLLYNLTCCACEDIALSDTELSQKATGSIHFLRTMYNKGSYNFSKNQHFKLFSTLCK